jgi:hypothetical protein
MEYTPRLISDGNRMGWQSNTTRKPNNIGNRASEWFYIHAELQMSGVTCKPLIRRGGYQVGIVDTLIPLFSEVYARHL